MRAIATTILRGAVSGLAGTVAMTGVMYAGKALGFLTVVPPKEITRHAERHAGMQPRRQPRSIFTASWLASHAGFGATCGAIFALLRRVVPGPAAPLGVLFGLLVWAVSYIGLMPSLGLYPAPEQDRSSRSAVMVAAHVAFGGVTAAVNERLR